MYDEDIMDQDDLLRAVGPMAQNVKMHLQATEGFQSCGMLLKL